MSNSGQPGAGESPVLRELNSGVIMDRLRAQGADRFDPVRFCFIEVMARRAGAHSGAAGEILEGKLAKALREYEEQFGRAKILAEDALNRAAGFFPDAAEYLRQAYTAGDFSGLGHLVARLEGQYSRASLAELTRHIAQHASESPEGGSKMDVGTAGGSYTELKSLKRFRDTWSKLSVDQQLTQALEQGPKNAGPLNSHLLVLQSLELMRDISPDYLNRFMSYVDALLWLEQADGSGNPAQKDAGRGESSKARKSGRAKSA